MSVALYKPDEEGNLLFLAEDDESDNPVLTLDEFLLEADEEDRVELYLALVGDAEEDEGAVAVVLEVDLDEPVGPRHAITASANFDDTETSEPAPKKRGRPRKETVEVEEETPAPKRRGRPPGSKNKPGAKKPGPKPGSAKKKKRVGVKSNPASEE
jgi:hypothetical protein